ncbi:hypothetical protein QLH52_04170 [Methylomonas sp. OY6]|uniref:Uncharacterized protein n=1 Tax=Methylomonas defluvii TaxID=3045149 RepID=A0ABU4UCL6_9GAMM|nr:hypothetical protein [Methylomonas sp. OY6]MDX8126464.1 hypothetical protein [Methylomonas sp. OY6]
MTQKTTQPALDSNTPAKTAAETGPTDSASTGTATAKGATTTAGKTASVKPAKNQPLAEQVKASAVAGDDLTSQDNDAGVGVGAGTDADANGDGDTESGTDNGVLDGDGDGDTDQAEVDGAGVSAHATIAADADADANIGRTRAPVGKSTGKTADLKGELSPEIVELVTELRDTVKQLAPNRHTPKTLKRALSNVAAILQDIDSLYQQAE